MANPLSTKLQTQLNRYVPNWYKLPLGKLLGLLVADQIVAYTTSAAVGGSAQEIYTVTGLAAADTILSVVCNSGGTGVPANGWSSQGANVLTIHGTANSVAGQTFLVNVSKAVNPDT